MELNLPEPIKRFFAAAGKSVEASQCFTEDGEVRDEERTHVGRDAIAAWITETTSAYAMTVEPLTVEEAGGKVPVTCKVTGTFPGSPINFLYAFTLEGDQISALEITV